MINIKCVGLLIHIKKSRYMELFYEPGHSISYKIACAPSDQPEHLSRLNKVFAVRLKARWTLATHSKPCEDSDQTALMRSLI